MSTPVIEQVPVESMTDREILVELLTGMRLFAAAIKKMSDSPQGRAMGQAMGIKF
jgi:hypothetical protein